MSEPGERREPVVTGLADIDPVMPLSSGMVVLVVVFFGSLVTNGTPPWTVPPTSDGASTLTTVLFVGSAIAVLLLAYGLLIVAAKVDAIYDMLRGRDSD
ncbi:hypothetical protein ASG73_02740 [Janibacter sp. Soil728]|uniref:hypothetical protein n=1 Tax=Janibacter sp. Soil728 TaxID=1736393 RepID=UPI0006F8844F|nr:hypothetical protein [Janibacter sp. Soil728]KRE39270.1 hypothetical protein ASG73_02740 [Janibacter sp. Soil728]